MKFIAIGELMLRLSPPNYEKIVTTHDFRVNYGGAEANVAVSLANLGVDSTFFTVLPNSDLGKSTINCYSFLLIISVIKTYCNLSALSGQVFRLNFLAIKLVSNLHCYWRIFT